MRIAFISKVTSQRIWCAYVHTPAKNYEMLLGEYSHIDHKPKDYIVPIIVEGFKEPLEDDYPGDEPLPYTYEVEHPSFVESFINNLIGLKTKPLCL